MILLLGGTSEAAPIAQAFAAKGCSVLVSTATDEQLNLGNSPTIKRRCGRLDVAQLEELARKSSIRVIVDAGHPYAVELHKVARDAAKRLALPYFRYLRPASAASDTDGLIIRSVTHEEAAEKAFSFGRPVLLTTGSKDVGVYAALSRQRGIRLTARVLPRPESVEACRKAGIPEAHIITGKGPFSKVQNIELIRQCNAGVIVTKDSGAEGGLKEKIEAAIETDCTLIMIERPEEFTGNCFSSINALVEAAAARRNNPA